MANTNTRSFPKGIREIRYPSNDIIQRFTSKDYTGTLRLNNETGEFEFDPPLAGTGSSAGTSFTVTQAAHGFTVGQPIYHNGTKYALANASDEDTLAMWVVVSVSSEDTFKAAQSGRYEVTGHGLVAGNFYFVSETDGGLTPTEPSTYSNPVIYVESADVFHVLPFRPSSTAASASGGAGDVQSVFGRTGAVVAETGDYTAEQVGLGNVLNVEQIPATEKASANGVATLDTNGKIPEDQLPAGVAGGINIIGFWDAATNTPDISTLTLNNGDAYQVSVSGTTELNGVSVWNLYDLAVWSNDVTGNWFRIVSNVTVNSVNDKIGAVVLGTDDIDEGVTNLYYTEDRVTANTTVVANTAKISADGSIDTHSDVDISSVVPTSGQTLVWDGTTFVPGDIVSGVSSVNGYVGIVVLDADDIDDTSTTNKWFTTTERTKLDGIEEGAEVNNMTDTQVDDLTLGASTTLHYHSSDRVRSNHTGTQTASTISDFDTAVSANSDVAANSAKVSASASINTHSDVDTNSITPTNGQALVWNGSSWIPGNVDSGGDMFKLTYDPNLIQSDVFDMDNMVEGTNNLILTQNERDVISELDSSALTADPNYVNGNTVDDPYTLCYAGGWGGYNLTTTSDPLIPTSAGDPTYVYTETTTPTSSVSAKNLATGIDVTMPQAGYIRGYRIYRVAGNTYTVLLVKDPGGDNEETTWITEFTAKEAGWKEFNLASRYVEEGVKFRLIILKSQPDDINTTLTSPYFYTSWNGGEPAAGYIHHPEWEPENMYVSKTDNDDVDNSTFLATLTVGDTIEAAGKNWAIQEIADNTGYVHFKVAPEEVADTNGITNVTFTALNSATMTYFVDTDYLLGNTAVNGLYIADGDYENAVSDDNMYGADLLYELLNVSEDWHIIEYPQGSTTIAEGTSLNSDLAIALSDETTDLTVSNDVSFEIIRDQTIESITLSVNTAPTGSSLLVDVLKGGVSILNTAITLAAGNTTVTTTDLSDKSLAVGDVIYVDITQVGATTAGIGAKIYFKTTVA